MLNPKEAVEKAEQHLEELFPMLPLIEIRLEEVVPFGDNWRITFSGTPTPEVPNTGTMAQFLQPRRVYKVVEVEARSGEFVSLRNPAA